MQSAIDNHLKIRVEYHPTTNGGTNKVASIRGLDVGEPCDAYTASELRTIARYLENIAEELDYKNSAAIQSTPFLLDIN